MQHRNTRGSKLRTMGVIAVAIAAISFTSINQSKAASTEAMPGQFLVRLKNPAALYSEHTLERDLGGPIIDRIREDMVLVQRSKSEPIESALKSLREDPNVTLAEPNFIFKASRIPNDTNFEKLWGLSNSGALDNEGLRGLRGVDISATRAWDITTGSKNVVVAVIDTGVDFKIPDLADNAWTNQAEAAGRPGVDDDNNGYVDDIHGYNFVNNTGNPTDDNGHGSHCAGTIGARGNDNHGVAGVNWNVSIMAVKFLDSRGSGSLANAVKAIDYARKNGAKILSNSWGGGGFTQALKDAIEETKKADELFVAAAGNDGADNDKTATYPANYAIDNIISVAAVDNRGELAYFSNFGANSVHLAGPGVNILSTVPTGFDTYSGTSMATPHVSGVAALVMSMNPRFTYAELKKRLMDSARPLRSLKGQMVTGGIVDAYYALTGSTPPADPNDPSVWTTTQPYAVSSPHPYGMKLNQTYTLTVPGATRLSARFTRFATEAGYDRVQFFNKKNELIGVWSGKYDGRFSPVADGDTLILKFTSDETVDDYGFDIDMVAFER